jgi:hypothetical protein
LYTPKSTSSCPLSFSSVHSPKRFTDPACDLSIATDYIDEYLDPDSSAIVIAPIIPMCKGNPDIKIEFSDSPRQFDAIFAVNDRLAWWDYLDEKVAKILIKTGMTVNGPRVDILIKPEFEEHWMYSRPSEKYRWADRLGLNLDWVDFNVRVDRRKCEPSDWDMMVTTDMRDDLLEQIRERRIEGSAA